MSKRLFGFLVLVVLMTGFSLVAHASEGSEQVESFLKKGIRFQTTDGNYSMTINPQIQIRYAYDAIEGAGNDIAAWVCWYLANR